MAFAVTQTLYLGEGIIDTGKISARVCTKAALWVIRPFYRSVYSALLAENSTDYKIFS